MGKWIEKNDSIVRIRFVGPLYIRKETFMELIKDQKDILSLLEDVEKRGWRWEIWGVRGVLPR